MNNENSKLGQHYKDTFSDFKAEPSPSVWENISRHSPGPATLPKNSLFTPAKMIIGAAVITTVAVVTWLTLSPKQDSKPVTEIAKTEISKPATAGSSDMASPGELTTSNGPENESRTAPGTTTQGTVTPANDRINPSQENITTQKTEQPSVLQPKTPAGAFSRIAVQPVAQNNAIPTRTPAGTIDPLPAKSSHASSPVAVCPDQMICKGESATLWASGGESYLWNNGQFSATITVSPDITTTYSVTITDALGEVTTEDVEVKVSNCQDLYVANAFTPDGDTYNDIFKAFGEDIQKFNMMIFSRQGQTVFESNDISQGWDGKVRGSMGDPGVYIYKITYTNASGESRVKTGQVNLIR